MNANRINFTLREMMVTELTSSVDTEVERSVDELGGCHGGHNGLGLQSR